MYFDIHAHMYKYPFPISRSKRTGALKPMFPTGEQLTAMHDALGITRAVILPVVVDREISSATRPSTRMWPVEAVRWTFPASRT